MIELSISKLSVLRKVAVSVMLACLLGAAIYYMPFENLGTLKPAYAFAWFEGNNPQADAEYTNETLLRYSLEMYFGLKNGSTIEVNGFGSNSPDGVSLANNREYNGSIDEAINSIEVGLLNARALGGTVYWLSGVNITTNVKATPRANMTSFENTTICSFLVTSDVLDMGSYTVETGPGVFNAVSTPGYWPDARHYVTNSPTWSITSAELLGFLESSGNATIMFEATFNVHLSYAINLPDNTTDTGEKDLSWSGTIGTIGIRYDESGIFEVQYDFVRVELALLTLAS